MAQQKRRTRQPKRRLPSKNRLARPAEARSGGHERRRAASQKGRAAARKARAAGKRRASVDAKARQAAEQQAIQIFDQQIDALWSRFTNECRQFAEGFNQEIGADQLRLDENTGGLMVRFTADGAEVFFQLDKAERHFECVMTTGCTSFGSCITEHAPIGLGLQDGQLRFVYGASTISEEELAVRVLTDLVESGSKV